MDRYTKVDQKKPNIPINENEIRITSQGLVRNYISYATTRIQERRGKEIVLKAMGQAISKTVAIAEFIKRNIPRLHQDTTICSISITDVWEPIEEGLLPVEMTRQVSLISITLSMEELNKNSPGYQPPVYVERSKPQYNSYQRQQPRQTQQPYNDEPYGGNYTGRGQGGGRVRGRGWNRYGGYGNYQGGDGYRNYQGDNGYGGNNYQGGARGYGNGNYQGGGRGYGNGNYRGGRGYGNYQGGGGEYGNNHHGGGGEYGNNHHGGGGEYGNNYHGGGEYRNYQDNNGYLNRGRGSVRGRGGNAGYRGSGYMRGGGGRGGGVNGRGGRGGMGGAE